MPLAGGTASTCSPQSWCISPDVPRTRERANFDCQLPQSSHARNSSLIVSMATIAADRGLAIDPNQLTTIYVATFENSIVLSFLMSIGIEPIECGLTVGCPDRFFHAKPLGQSRWILRKPSNSGRRNSDRDHGVGTIIVPLP